MTTQSLTPAQSEVLSVLRKHGPLPDHVLVPIVQHAGEMHQSSSGIRSRRAELFAKGLVVSTGEKVTMPSGRHAATYEAV